MWVSIKIFVYNIVLIGFAFSPAVSSAVRNLASTSTCRVSEFTCLDGTCIRAGAVCNTYWDCPDGSDEASCNSSTNSNLTEATVSAYERYKRQSACGSDQWRCLNGTCIAVTARCDAKVDCPDGSDENYCLDGTLLNQTLQSSFQKALGATFGSQPDPPPPLKSGENAETVFCSLDPDASIHYYCQVPTTNIYRICKQLLPLGTFVKPECNAPNYYYDSKNLPSMTCQSDGKWNRVIKCIPECGRVTPNSRPLIFGGTEVDRGELPWHVAIYRKPTQKNNYYEQICGGSIITNNFVISAAHCFWNSGKGEKNAASNYAVATAKLFRDWDHKDDTDAQKSELKSIEIPLRFRGVLTNYQHDVAVLNLETPFVYYTYVRPVCLNLKSDINRRQLRKGNFGKFAGWGLTEENGLSSTVLKVVQLPFVPIQECIRIAPPSFTENISGDKICAGYDNGTAAVCKGDSGGGLFFPETDSDDITRYYLRGVASTAPRSNSLKKCNIYGITTFTEIYQHKDFINEVYASVALNTFLKTYLTEFVKSVIASKSPQTN